MSRIEDALNKLRGERPPGRGAAKARVSPAVARSAVPIARRKRVEIVGPKHHVSQDDLVAGGLLAPFDDFVAIADEFRRIKRPLIANAVASDTAHQTNVVMIASALPGSGKTFCAVNLAVSVSLERELNVLLVDADVAKPHISRAFGLDEAPGLIDLLLDETLDLAEMLVRTDLNDIQVLPAGRRHPEATELLASDRMTSIMRELSGRYSDRLIILDSPPLMITSEAQALAGQVGQIVLIVEAGRTSREMLTQTIETLDPNKAVNLILNKGWYWGWGGGNYNAATYPYSAYEGV